MKKINGLVCVVMVLHVLNIVPQLLRADDQETSAEKNPIGPLQRFIGEWTTQGKWSTGEELRARTVYEYGVGKKIITAKTYVMNGDREYQRYEGILAYHPTKKCLFEITFAFNGELSEVVIETKADDTLQIAYTPFTEGQPSNVRQTIQFKDKNRFVWTVQVKRAEEWKQLIESTWHRKKQ